MIALANHILRPLADRLCKNLDAVVLYESKVGIKCLNQPVSSDLFGYFADPDIKEMLPEKLYLGFDGLKDAYTLLNTKIVDSPHYRLMRCLATNEDPAELEYVRRFSLGTLDFCPPRRPRRVFLGHLRKCYQAKREIIASGRYPPIKAVLVDGRYYIADGKHTAALCAFLGVGLKCQEATRLMYDSFFSCVYRRMLKSPASYRRNIAHFESFTTKRGNGV